MGIWHVPGHLANYHPYDDVEAWICVWIGHTAHTRSLSINIYVYYVDSHNQRFCAWQIFRHEVLWFWLEGTLCSWFLVGSSFPDMITNTTHTHTLNHIIWTLIKSFVRLHHSQVHKISGAFSVRGGRRCFVTNDAAVIFPRILFYFIVCSSITKTS